MYWNIRDYLIYFLYSGHELVWFYKKKAELLHSALNFGDLTDYLTSKKSSLSFEFNLIDETTKLIVCGPIFCVMP